MEGISGGVGINAKRQIDRFDAIALPKNRITLAAYPIYFHRIYRHLLRRGVCDHELRQRERILVFVTFLATSCRYQQECNGNGRCHSHYPFPSRRLFHI